MLHPEAPVLSQFFTSAFLHANLLHLIGNMIFLWVFGNAMNDRFGHLGYLAFYLAGGVMAGVWYVIMSGTAPVLGASGAISAVTGAYLVLLPRARVLVMALLLYIFVPFELSSLYFIGIQIAFNLLMVAVDTGGHAGGVAYWAHIGGYVIGIAVAAGLLATRILPRDAFDLLNLIRAGHRRRQYRRMVSQGWDPFGRGGPGPGEDTSRWVSSRTVGSSTPDNVLSREMDIRKNIAEACSAHNLAVAADKYVELVQLADDAVLPRQQQLDVANQLMASERYPQAADAYERFLKHYSGYEHLSDIHLMLGLLYGRYLQQYDRAEHYLQLAAESLRDPRKADLARSDLAMVRQRRRG
jgi:membrane associated rhomboid family serine protease